MTIFHDFLLRKTEEMKKVLESSIQRRAGRLKDEKVGEPYDCIPIKNMKGARETDELHMGNSNIEILSPSFKHFRNLEVLWLNGNKLLSLEGLDTNFRIKELYLHNNWLKSLEGSISKMNHLSTLTLYNN